MLVQSDRMNVIICPSCGHENIEGSDSCVNCQTDLSASGVPASGQPASDSDLATPLSNLRLRTPSTVEATASVREAIALLRAEPGGGLVVVSAGRIAGIFTERDVLTRIAGHGGKMDDPVSQYMTPDPVVLRQDDSMAVALNKMGVGGFRHVPVTHDDELVGLVTARDLMGWVMARFFE